MMYYRIAAVLLGLWFSPVSAWILDRQKLIDDAGLPEPSWYLDHVPFIDLPIDDGEAVRQIQEVYYYRWSVIHRQHHQDRFKSASYVGGYLGLNGNGGGATQWLDERWMRNITWVQDQIASHSISPEGRYSDGVADNLYQWAITTGNYDLLKDYAWDFVQHIDAWQAYYDQEVGLYWHQPVWDASEHTLASAQTRFIVPSDVQFSPIEAFLVPESSFFGGYGYTVPFNTYIIADSRIIVKLMTVLGEQDTADRFQKLADGLQSRLEQVNWDGDRGFYYHVMKDNYYQNYSDADERIQANLTRLDGKEIFGFLPWQFNIPADDDAHAGVWQNLRDSSVFGSEYGPSTSELGNALTLTSSYYNPDLFDGNCCRWSGPNWPFSTSKTCIALANFLNNYQTTGNVTKADHFDLLSKFAKIQYKDEQPYVAEAHDPRNETWIYDEQAYSNHYYHYPYNTVVLSDLIGIRSQENNTIVINPLVPDEWDWFGAEFPYKGKDYTLIWDRDGSHYNRGSGLILFDADDNVVAQCDTLQRIQADVESCATPEQRRRANYAANGSRIPNVFGGTPYPFPWGYGSYGGATHGDKFGSDERWSLSFTNNPSRRGEAPQNAFDGQTMYDTDLWYARWTNVGSNNTDDWLAIDFGVERNIDEVKIYTWVNGTTAAPTNLTLQYISGADSPYNASANASTLQWTDISGIQYPSTYGANDVNILTFASLPMQNLRILFAQGDVVGVTEIQAWGDYDESSVNCPSQSHSANHYEAESAVIFQGTVIGSPYACDWGVAAGLNTIGIDYFVKDFGAVTRGNFSGTTSGEQWQGNAGNAYIEWFVNVDAGGQQNMTLRYANGGSDTATFDLAIDGSPQGSVDLPPTGGYSLVKGGLQLVSTFVEVDQGSHRIRLTKTDKGFAEFDYMELETA